MLRSFLKREVLFLFALVIILLGTVMLCVDRYETSTVMSDVTSETLPAVPILMYHSVCDNKKVTSDYRVTPQMLESDLEYLSKNGYTSILVSDLVAYVHDGALLPQKPVIITLDDGYLNNLTNVFPLLEKYDVRRNTK